MNLLNSDVRYQFCPSWIFRWRCWLGRFLMGLLLALSLSLVSTPVMAQLEGLSGGSFDQTAVGWVVLDGRQVFQIAAPSSALSIRQYHLEENLKEIRDTYVSMPDPAVEIVKETLDGEDAPSLYVNGRYLMTATDDDARMQGMTQVELVQYLRQSVTQALRRAYQERQPAYLKRAGLMAVGAVMGAIAIALILQFSRYGLFAWAVKRLHGKPLEELSENHRQQLHAIRHILLPLLQFVVLVGAMIWSLGLFPYTRTFQNSLLNWAKVPAAVAIIAIVAYLGVRISYLLIDRFTSTLQDRNGFSFENYRRLELRISTISSVIKNIANFVWLAIGLIVALSIFGINLGVLLASFGLVGLALSLAAQNLIKGAVTGFFILLEDQYAIGDIVKIGEDAGLVENMNLRITQLRDAEGRLITIPTSDINRVANYSLHWSRCDLQIPVNYHADIDEMLQLARKVGDELRNDPDWRDLILETPDILGVEDFGDSAVILRVWIKTQPMKQWDVSREYRRRFKQSVQDSGTSIPFPQRQVWLNAPDGLQVSLSGDLNQVGQNDSSQHDSNDGPSHGPSHGPRVKTDRQPRNISSDSNDIDGNDIDGGDGEAADVE